MTKTIVSAAVRFVKARDSATTILRKLGIKACDYGLFIEKGQDGTLTVQVAKAKMHLENLAKPKTQTKPAKRPGLKSDPSTCSAVARTLIREGKTNAEVWQEIKREFNLDDKKRGYPAWYRFQLRKAGEKV